MQQQLTREQHGIGLYGSTYTWIFSANMHSSTTWSPVGWIPPMQNCIYRRLTIKFYVDFQLPWESAHLSPVLFRVNCSWKTYFALAGFYNYLHSCLSHETRSARTTGAGLFFSLPNIFYFMKVPGREHLQWIFWTTVSILGMWLIIVFALFDFYWSCIEYLPYYKI